MDKYYETTTLSSITVLQDCAPKTGMQDVSRPWTLYLEQAIILLVIIVVLAGRISGFWLVLSASNASTRAPPTIEFAT